MSFAMRPYQGACVDAFDSAFAIHRTALGVLPTGTGKTVVFAHLCHRQSNRCMVIAHREELIDQAARKILAVTGVHPDIEMADRRAGTLLKSPYVVASVQTLNAGRVPRMQRFDPSEFDMLVIDEAHHAVSDSYRRVISHFMANPELRMPGFTATPDRLDNLAMGSVFETVAFRYEILDALNDGWLCPVVVKQIFVKEIDLANVRTTAGDLNGKDLSEQMEKERVCHEIVRAMIDELHGRRALVFAVTVAQAELMCDIANTAGLPSAVVHGGTHSDERRRTLRMYAAGKYRALFNVGIATEGFDDPGIEVVVLGRPTKSRALMAQQVGRGTRVLPGVVDGIEQADLRRAAIAACPKPSVLVLDFTGNTGRHKLVSPADILGGRFPEEVTRRAAKSALDGEVDIVAACLKAEDEIAAEEERERSRKAKLAVEKVEYTAKLVNAFDVFGIEPERARQAMNKPPLTTGQLDWLRSAGVPVDGTPMEQLRAIHGEMINRKKRGLCTYKMAKQLRKFGYDPNMKFDEARKLMDRLAQNNWKPLLESVHR